MSTKKIIYIDMDDVLCAYSEAHKLALTNNPNILYPQSQFDFYRNLSPISGAIDAALFLEQQAIFDVYILTAPSILNPMCYTEKRIWVEQHLGINMVNKLIISPNKGLNKGHYLIDDHPSGRGQEYFEGKFIHFGSQKFKDWEAVLNYFHTNYSLA